MSAPDNPPAFPRANEYQRGMTLRDYFAGQALAGFASNEQSYGQTNQSRAFNAYFIADAMLAERAKGGAS